MKIMLSRFIALAVILGAVAGAKADPANGSVALNADGQKQSDQLKARQDTAANMLLTDKTLLTNGDFESPAQGGAWSKDWGSPSAGMAREEEGANFFTRLQVVEPGKGVTLYRLVDLPAGLKALEIGWRWRVEGLELGTRKQNDARIIFAFRDAKGKVLDERPNAAYHNTRTTKGWVEKTTKFRVPKEAVALEIMPALYEAKAGTLDIDDIRIREGDIRMVMADEAASKMPPDLSPEAPQPEKFPRELHVEGNKLVNSAGETVWLQGVNTAGLEWNPKGESVLKRIVVAIEDWKANVIRLPIKSELWNGPDRDSYRALVDAAINMAANRGAYVVVDLHVYRAIKKEHIAFWKEFLAKYKNHPALIFDIINEPHGITWEVWKNGGFVEERKSKADEDAFLDESEREKAKEGFESPGMQAAVDEIRETGAKNILVAGALDYSYDLSGILKGFALVDTGGNGIMYSTHVYPWKTNWQESFLDVAAVHPILVGELGADHKKLEFIPHERQELPETWVPDMLGIIQERKLNWTGWCFHPSAGPRMLEDWKLTPTPVWGAMAKRALAGEEFKCEKLR